MSLPGRREAAQAPSLVTLVRLIRREYVVHGSDWSLPGFRAMAVYRFGRWLLDRDRGTLLRRLTGRFWDRFYITLHRYIRNRYGIEISRNARIGRDTLVVHQGGIVIGWHAVVGERCMIHQNVAIGNAGRGVSVDKAPTIGDDVELGVGAAVLGNVVVGDGARIGANVVVYTNVPAGATVVNHAPRFIYAPQARQPRAIPGGD